MSAQRYALSALLLGALSHYRTQGVRDDEGDGRRLVDLFTPDGAESIREGRHELDLLAEHLAEAVDGGPSPYHYTEDGDYPTDDREVLISTRDMEQPAGAWLEVKDSKPWRWAVYADREYFLKPSAVYAWQELPAKAPRRGEG